MITLLILAAVGTWAFFALLGYSLARMAAESAEPLEGRAQP